MESQSETILVMEEQFNQSPEEVFDAWIDPEQFGQFLFTVKETNKVAENDPEAGGKWEVVDVREGTEYRAIGEYKKIDRPNTLVFTFEMPQFSDTSDDITVEFESDGEGTRIIFTQTIIVPHEAEWTDEDIEQAEREYVEQLREGHQMMFKRLAQLLERGYADNPYEDM